MNSGSETYPGYKQDVKDFALLLYAYMKEYCIGREISTRELVSEAVGPTSALGSDGEVATDDELWDVHNALYDIVEREETRWMVGRTIWSSFLTRSTSSDILKNVNDSTAAEANGRMGDIDLHDLSQRMCSAKSTIQGKPVVGSTKYLRNCSQKGKDARPCGNTNKEAHDTH